MSTVNTFNVIIYLSRMYKSFGMYKLRHLWWGGEGAAIEGPLIAGDIHSCPTIRTLACLGANSVFRSQGELNCNERARWGAGRSGNGQAAWSCVVESRAECAAVSDAEQWVLSHMQSAEHENWALNAECWSGQVAFYSLPPLGCLLCD